MRNDLESMGPGRAAAQASHAANAFIKEYKYRKDVKEWEKQTPQGFGTVIVLRVNIEMLKETMSNLIKSHMGYDHPHDKIYDPDYHFTVNKEISFLLKENKFVHLVEEKENDYVIFSKKELTCAYIFGEKEELFPILGHLPLY